MMIEMVLKEDRRPLRKTVSSFPNSDYSVVVKSTGRLSGEPIATKPDDTYAGSRYQDSYYRGFEAPPVKLPLTKRERISEARNTKNPPFKMARDVLIADGSATMHGTETKTYRLKYKHALPFQWIEAADQVLAREGLPPIGRGSWN